MNPTKLILGARYGDTHWPLSPYTYWDGTRAVNARFPEELGWPQSVRPPLNVATDVIQKCFGIGPTMGSDPEVFIARADGTRVPAFEVLPDKATAKKKEDPKSGGYRFNWFWDGYQAETQLPGLTCHTSFMNYWRHQIGKLVEQRLKMVPGPVWRVPEESLERAAEEHVGLGCSPSKNAYGLDGRPVENPRMLKWRFAGGHLHFEAKLDELEAHGISTPYIVKAIDCFLGVPSVALFANYDSPIRRRFYGLPGEFRTPKHGLEYRVLSNGWLMHPQAFQLVTDLARHAFNLGRTRLRRVWVGREELVRDIIQYNDVRSARDLMKLNKEFYDAWLDVRYGNIAKMAAATNYKGGKKSFWGAISGGLENVIDGFAKDPMTSWGFGSDETCERYALKCLWNQLP